MTTDLTFITNEENNKLVDRFAALIKDSQYFDCFIDINGEYVARKSTIIIRNAKNNIKLETLLAFFNSRIVGFFIKEAYSATGIGGGVNFTAPMIRDIPLPVIDENEIKVLEKLANETILLTYSADFLENLDKQAKVKTLENQIDQLVYKLYDLTPEEIKIVEEFNEGE